MEFTEIITQLGFPIACVIGIAIFCVKVLDAYRTDMKEQSASHKDEMSSITTALNNNTLALNKVTEQNKEIMELLKEVKKSESDK